MRDRPPKTTIPTNRTKDRTEMALGLIPMCLVSESDHRDNMSHSHYRHRLGHTSALGTDLPCTNTPNSGSTFDWWV